MNKICSMVVTCLTAILVLSGCGDKDPIYNDHSMVSRSSAQQQALQGLRNSENPQAGLMAAWGGKLEDRIRADFKSRGKELSAEAKIQLMQKKDSSVLKLESKNGELEGLVNKGEVLVIVSNDKNKHDGKYFLACLNGMVSEYDPKAFHDRGQIRNYPFSFTVNKGHGFTQALSTSEAIQAASDLGLPVYPTRLNEAVVDIPVGFCLSKESPDAKWKVCK